MRQVTLIGVAFIRSAVLGACSSNRTNVDAANDGFVALFDGATLTGWTQRGGNAEYRVEDGCIVGATRPNQPNSFLCTDRTYRDFVLELDFRIDRELNSGIQIRSNSIPDYRNGVVHGYQVEIDPTDRAWTGGLYDESRRGWLAPEVTSPEAKAAFKQSFTALVRGEDHIIANHLPVRSREEFLIGQCPQAHFHRGGHGRGQQLKVVNYSGDTAPLTLLPKHTVMRLDIQLVYLQG